MQALKEQITDYTRCIKVTYSNLEFIDFFLVLKHAQLRLQLAYFSSECFNSEVSFFDGTILVSITNDIVIRIAVLLLQIHLSLSFLISALSFSITAFRSAISLSLSSDCFFQSANWLSYLDSRFRISLLES